MKKFKELPSEHQAQETVSDLNAQIKKQDDDLKLTNQTLKNKQDLIERLEEGYDGDFKKLEKELETLKEDYNELNLKYIIQGGSLEEKIKQLQEKDKEIAKLTQQLQRQDSTQF